MDSEAPTITVEIGQHCVTGVQVDGGAAVSLMTDQTMQELGLQNLEPTNIVLRVADQRSEIVGNSSRRENNGCRFGILC